MSLLDRIRKMRAANEAIDALPEKPSRVLTVRMPSTLHSRIKDFSRKNGVSINMIAVMAIEEALAESSRMEDANNVGNDPSDTEAVGVCSASLPMG